MNKVFHSHIYAKSKVQYMQNHKVTYFMLSQTIGSERGLLSLVTSSTISVHIYTHQPHNLEGDGLLYCNM